MYTYIKYFLTKKIYLKIYCLHRFAKSPLKIFLKYTIFIMIMESCKKLENENVLTTAIKNAGSLPV